LGRWWSSWLAAMASMPYSLVAGSRSSQSPRKPRQTLKTAAYGPLSETLFCDHVSLSSCQSAHQHEKGGAYVPRPRQRTSSTG
jgi:hypothetical protein